MCSDSCPILKLLMTQRTLVILCLHCLNNIFYFALGILLACIYTKARKDFTLKVMNLLAHCYFCSWNRGFRIFIISRQRLLKLPVWSIGVILLVDHSALLSQHVSRLLFHRCSLQPEDIHSLYVILIPGLFMFNCNTRKTYGKFNTAAYD